MESFRWRNRVPRVVALPLVFALGAVLAMGLRGSAGQKNAQPPVQPPNEAIQQQSAFEQVADRMRPCVVFIQSRQAVSAPVRQDQDNGDDNNNPFNFSFPFQNAPGQRFHFSVPNMPQFPRHSEASGSGVIVRSDGYILTNDHVVQGADRVTVTLRDGRKFAGRVLRDYRSDLAVIKIDASGLPAAQLADSNKCKVGQWAIAFGSPFGLSDTMTVGVVSSLNREQQIGEGNELRFYPRLIQTDASINPGNSGGPLVDIWGRVIGINVAIESPSGGNVGIGFTIPSNTAEYVMDQLIANGKVVRGYLGLAPQTLSYEQQQKYGVKEGALVASVEDNTPASRAGFQVEDVITKFDGQPVSDDASFRDMVARTKPGSNVEVVVRRNGVSRTLQVTVGTAPSLEVAEAPGPNREQPATPRRAAKLGVSIADVTDQALRDQYKLGPDVTSGAVITDVMQGGPAADAGVAVGDVVVRLNERPVRSAASLLEVVSGLQPDTTVSAVIRRGKQTLLVQLNIE